MKPWLRYAGLALFFYISFLLATLPAAHAYALLKGQLAPLQLSDLEGTLWSGRAQQAAIGSYKLGELSWQFRPWALALGRIEGQWLARKDNGTASGLAARTFAGNVQLREVNATLPITDLGTLFNFGPAQPEGQLKAQLAYVRIDGTLSAAQGTLRWEAARLLSPHTVNLGTFAMRLETSDAAIKGTLLDQGGPLKAQGVLTIKPNGAYQFTGVFAPSGGAQSELSQALAWLGPAGADGKISVSWLGSLPGGAPPSSGRQAKLGLAK